MEKENYEPKEQLDTMPGRNNSGYTWQTKDEAQNETATIPSSELSQIALEHQTKSEDSLPPNKVESNETISVHIPPIQDTDSAKVLEGIEFISQKLESIDSIDSKIDVLDKNLKKILLSFNSSSNTANNYEERIFDLKNAMIEIIDLIEHFKNAVWKSNAVGLQDGLRQTESIINKILNNIGLVKMPIKQGDIFDPAIMEGLKSENYDKKLSDNCVFEVLKSGYMDKSTGKIIRCAQVTVNSKPQRGIPNPFNQKIKK